MTTSKYGLVCDFDGTVALTFEPSPGGIGVTQAYEYALLDLFGEDALRHYRDAGGLRMRSPREVVGELQQAGLLNGHSVEDGTEALVQRKVAYLAEEFGQPFPDGSRWPRLTPGFPEYWRKASTHPDICTVILSSGHREPIRKTFEIHGLPQPDLMVTDDDLRVLDEPLCKPDPRLWQFMCARALEVGVTITDRAVYIGDDSDKDGCLAARAGVDFLLFNGNGKKRFPHRLISDWSALEVPPAVS